MNKKGFEISFAWLFGIIVGAFILALAIYGVAKFMGVGQTASDLNLEKQIGVILNPLEIGFESAKSTSMEVPVEARINNICIESGSFGRQELNVSQKSFGKWSSTDIAAGFTNKYIFSDEFVEGRKFFLFSKPFNFPFKVSDLIYMTSSQKKYCFINAPSEVKDELLGLKQENMLAENCSLRSDVIKVCFGDSSCEIYVNLENNYVRKNKERMYFVIPKDNFGDEDYALMYAAVFSESDVYECQLQRLMGRLSSLASLYDNKAEFVSRVGCDSNLNLVGLRSLADGFSASKDLNLIFNLEEEIKDKNDLAECKLW